MSWLFASRWPKYWRFSFSISPSNEYSMSISFRIDWFDLHCVSYPVDSCPINIRYECIYLLTGVFLFLCHCSRCVSYESLMFGFSVGYLLSYLLWRWTLWVLTSFVLVYAIHLAFLGLLAFFLAACVHAKSLPPCQTLFDPMDCSLPGSSVHRDSPGKNTGVGCPGLLQGIFLSQGSNSHLLSLLPWQVVVFFFLKPPAPPGKPFFSSSLWPNVLCICSFYPSDLKNCEFYFYWVNGYPCISKSDRSYVLTSVSKMPPALMTLSRESDRPNTLACLSRSCPPPTSQGFFGTS